MRILAGLLLVGVFFGQSALPDVKATDGISIFQFSKLAFGKVASGERWRCQLRGVAINTSPREYRSLEFQVEVKGKAGRARMTYAPVNLAPGASVDMRIDCPDDIEPFLAERATFSYLAGTPVLSSEDLNKRDRAVTEAIFTKPVVRSIFKAIVIGDDPECAVDYGKAVDAGGVDGRKRITEIVAHGCGFVTPTGTHVETITVKGDALRVRMLDGPHPGKEGWVLRRFMGEPNSMITNPIE